MSGDLCGKRILVTGAANGIGRALARRSADGGSHLTLVDRDPAVHELASELGALGVDIDITEPHSAERTVAAAVAHWGGLDGLANVAGVHRSGAITQLAPDVWDLVMALNVTAPFLWARAAMPALLDGGGAIVNVGSISSVAAIPATPAYVASKHALLGLTKSIAIDFGRRGVRANCVSPGSIETEFLTRYLCGDEAARERLVERNFAGRLGQPEEVAECCAFLLGDGATFINGENIVIDGARTVAT